MGSCVGKSDLSELRVRLAKPLQARRASPSLETDQSLSCAGNVAPGLLFGLLRGLYCIGLSFGLSGWQVGHPGKLSLDSRTLCISRGGCCLFCSGCAQVTSAYDGDHLILCTYPHKSTTAASSPDLLLPILPVLLLPGP